MLTPCFFKAVSICEKATEIGRFPTIHFVVGPFSMVKNGFLSKTDRAYPRKLIPLVSRNLRASIFRGQILQRFHQCLQSRSTSHSPGRFLVVSNDRSIHENDDKHKKIIKDIDCIPYISITL